MERDRLIDDIVNKFIEKGYWNYMPIYNYIKLHDGREICEIKCRYVKDIADYEFLEDWGECDGKTEDGGTIWLKVIFADEDEYGFRTNIKRLGDLDDMAIFDIWQRMRFE